MVSPMGKFDRLAMAVVRLERPFQAYLNTQIAIGRGSRRQND
jgi:hypothetical protein